MNLAYRWFCRLDLEQRVPDHSTFSKNRHGRFRQSDAFRHLFESVLRRCMKEGLVGGEGFAIDARVIKADASRASRWTEGDAPTRAVRRSAESSSDGCLGSDPAVRSIVFPFCERAWTCALLEKPGTRDVCLARSLG